MQPLPPRPARTWIEASSMKAKAGGIGRRGEAPARERRSCLFGGEDVHELAAAAPVLELDDAVDLREQGVVLAPADVEAREEAGAVLTHEDRAAGDPLAAEALDPEVLRLGVATVAAR